MKKHPFVIFLLAIAVLITGVISFIQSPGFANILKGFVAKHLPSDLGIQANFSDLSIGLFPPSVSIRNPKVELSQHNLISLPPGSTVIAKRIDLRFRLFQMFGGNIRINEVAVVDGDVNLVLHTPPEAKKAQKSFRPQINWDELFQIRAEAVALENTMIHIRFADSPFTADLTAEQLRLAQWKGHGGIGYELRADLKDLNSSVLKDWVPASGINRLSAIAHVNAEGLQIDDLATLLEGVDIHVSGQIRGNVLNAKELPFELRVGLRADLAAANRFLAEKRKIDAQGSVDVDARVRGNLLAIEETLKAEGQINGEHVRYGRWVADRVMLESGYAATGTGRKGEVNFGRGLIESAEVPRIGGHQPGSGGRVEIGAFRYVIGARDPVSVPLKLERAHLQWLGAGDLKDMYPMDTRISGAVAASFSPSKDNQPWNLQAGVNLAIDEFQLDNQRFGQEKPLKKVLQIKNLKIDGPVTLNPAGISFGGVVLTLPHTKLVVTGGVTGKEGFNILGQGNITLADVGQLAEVPIFGNGPLKIHVHGPGARCLIDFDADLQEAQYLRLKLGALNGRITWDDDPQYLFFDHVHALKGQTNYDVNGKLDLGKVETINLSVGIPSGNIIDLTGIFEDFTQDFWWFPHAMIGSVTGSAKVTGGLAMSQMIISTELSGNNWEYLGERVRTVRLKGGYDKGKYQITDLRGAKQGGKFAGRISYDADRRFDWDFKTQDIQVTDLDHLARLDVPFRGRIHFDSHGSGKEETLQSVTQGAFTDISVRGVGYGSSNFVIKTDKGIATGSGVGFGDQGEFDFSYGLKPGIPSKIRFEGRKLDFSPLVLLLNPKLMQDGGLQADFTGSVKLAFLSGEIERATGSISLGDYRLSKVGTEFKLAHPVSAKITDGNFVIRDLTLVGPSNSVTLNLRAKPTNLDGTVTGGLDLGITEFLTSTIGKASGSADLDVTIDGVLKAPKIYGTADIEAGSLRIPALDSPFENATGTLKLRENVVTVQNLESDLGGGRVRLGGTVTLFSDRYPTLALKGELSGNRVRVYPFQYVKLRGGLDVNGQERPYLVDGNLTVESALSKEKLLGAKQEQGLRSMQYTPANSARGDLDQPLFKLKIDVAADHGIMVQNDLFYDTELKAKITVVNTIEAPRIIGTVDLIQGKIKFKDRVFQVQSANAVFDNPNVLNPQFNLTASTDVSNTKVQLYASGRLPDRWKIDLTSNPAMAESEILSLLAVGNTSATANQRLTNTAVDRSAAQQGEAASLLLQSLDFNREVQEKTGFEFQLDEYENNLVGQSIFSRNLNETTVAPKIVVRRRLGDRVTVSYGSTVGVDTNKQTEANVELHVTQGFSVLGVWDSYEFNNLQQKLDSESSYGFDFKLQKRFK